MAWLLFGFKEDPGTCLMSKQCLLAVAKELVTSINGDDDSWAGEGTEHGQGGKNAMAEGWRLPNALIIVRAWASRMNCSRPLPADESTQLESLPPSTKRGQRRPSIQQGRAVAPQMIRGGLQIY